MSRPPRVLLVDNYDSFTWNLAQYVAMVLGAPPRVVRNDELPVEELVAWEPDAVIVSPGPGTPDEPRDVGVCRSLVERLPRVPLLGVCLGHQVLGAVEGARVMLAPEPRHGRMSLVTHDGSGLFAELPSPLSVVRYHSLVLDRKSLPPSLRVVAETSDGLVMAIAHRERPHFGVQFHPESIETRRGLELIARFLSIAGLARNVAQPIAVAAERDLEQPRAVDARTRARTIGWCDPERAFMALFAEAPRSFWLDGNGRYSYMGAGAREWMTARGDRIEHVVDGRVERLAGDPFTHLGRRLSELALDGDRPASAPPLGSGFVGCLGYELKAFAGGDRDPAQPRDDDDAPDLLLMRADRVLAFDREARALTLSALLMRDEPDEIAERWFDDTEARLAAVPDPLPPAAPISTPIAFRVDRGRRAYLDDVERIHASLRAGDTYEICLTTQLRARAPLDPLALFRLLRCSNPAPYATFLRFPERVLVSASPERFVHIDERGLVESRPIKGTRPRGSTPEEDARLRDDLGGAEKDRAENLMIVDLVRNDLGRVCEAGSVRVPRLMDVEAHPSVFQLVSTVRGQLSAGVAPVEAVRALFPGGSMTGAPKIRSMRILSSIERRRRGLYSGALGFFSLSGAVDLAMTIRTVVFRGDELSIGVGGAVVALSDAASEYDEALTKARALLDAIAQLTGARVVVED